MASGQSFRSHDLCLVFPYKSHALVKWGDSSADARELRNPTAAEEATMQEWQRDREKVLAALQAAGLGVMAFYSRDRDEIFVKVGASAAKLAALAEQMRYTLLMKEQFCGAFADFRQDKPGTVANQYADRNVCSHLYQQHVHEGVLPDEGSIFRSVDRIRLLDYAIRSKDKGCAGVEVGRLLRSKNLLLYFPLPESREVEKLEADTFNVFVTGKKIDAVRNYFGEKVAFYFLFMSYFNGWLLSGSMVSLFFIVIDLTFGTPNNFATYIFCVFVIVWLVAFPHWWKRRSSTFALRWGTLHSTDTQAEATRSDFNATSTRVSPITNRPELYYPARERAFKTATSFGILLVVVAAMLVLMFFIFTLRHLLNETWPFWGRIFFMMLLAVSIEIVNATFSWLARLLNNWENHRTDSEFDASLMAKTFVFKCLTTYTPLYYIAFIKNHSYLMGMEMECVDSDCLLETSCQIAMFFFVKVVFQNIWEWVGPVVTMWWRNWSEYKDTSRIRRGTVQDQSPVEQHSKKPVFDHFDNMDEVVNMYGLTVLFWCACPWTTLAMLGAQLIECSGDGQNLLETSQRTFPTRAKDNQPWDAAFDLLSHLAVFTNLATVVFGVPSTYFNLKGKVIIFFALEHLYLLVLALLRSSVPAMPTEVEHLSSKQALLVKKHLDCQEQEAPLSVARGTAPQTYVQERDDEEDELMDSTSSAGCAVQ